MPNFRFLVCFFSLLLSSTRLFAAGSAPLYIGMPVCLSGPCAISGSNAIHGATLALQDLNQKGGVLGRQLVLEVEDSQDAVSGARAVTAYRALRIKKDIHLFIGPSWTPGLLALVPYSPKP